MEDEKLPSLLLAPEAGTSQRTARAKTELLHANSSNTITKRRARTSPHHSSKTKSTKWVVSRLSYRRDYATFT